ncbi:MAG: hypothetical protein COA78_02305 [Blastopirellula sp.]|nr:MAG: hypothetical protein COA78_02305 [Blastopirellula sp.]
MLRGIGSGIWVAALSVLENAGYIQPSLFKTGRVRLSSIKIATKLNIPEHDLIAFAPKSTKFRDSNPFYVDPLVSPGSNLCF